MDLKTLSKEEFGKIHLHNKNVMSNSNGELNPSEVRNMYEKSFDHFAHQLMTTRFGTKDKDGREVSPNDISFDKALKFYYGCDMNTWMRQMGMYSNNDTLSDIAHRFGHSNLNADSVESLLKDHTSFDGTNISTQINQEFRFLIPELILNAIRIGYEGNTMWTNWVSSSVNISKRKVTMPNILRGNSAVRRIKEAESMPFGTVSFGQKEAKVFKVGTGFKITDELIEDSALDLLFVFLQEVGIDMTIGADVNAMDVLINGEQAGGGESAPVVGVDTATSFAFKDVQRVASRMRRLKNEPSRIITGEEDGLDLTNLPKFQGFDGPTRLAEIRSILGVPPVMENDVWAMPANQILFLNPARCMVHLKYKGLKVETRRNPQNQTDETFVSDHVGFAIQRRDARVILDKSITYIGNEFPAYMDIDARINESFKTIDE